MAATLISLDHPVYWIFWLRLGRCFTPTEYLKDEGSSHEVPVPFTSLFWFLFGLISFIIRIVMIRCQNHQRFYRGTISRKIASQDWRLLLIMRYGYTLMDATKVLACHRNIIIITIIISLSLRIKMLHKNRSNVYKLSGEREESS